MAAGDRAAAKHRISAPPNTLNRMETTWRTPQSLRSRFCRQAGKQYQPNVDRAIDFILARVEASPVDGLAITDSRGTQIQRKLGPYIDT